jgi:hypothetical protein
MRARHEEAGVHEAVEVEGGELPADAGVRRRLVPGHRVSRRPHEEIEPSSGRLVEDPEGVDRLVDGIRGHRPGS